MHARPRECFPLIILILFVSSLLPRSIVAALGDDGGESAYVAPKYEYVRSEFYKRLLSYILTLYHIPVLLLVALYQCYMICTYDEQVA